MQQKSFKHSNGFGAEHRVRKIRDTRSFLVWILLVALFSSISGLVALSNASNPANALPHITDTVRHEGTLYVSDS